MHGSDQDTKSIEEKLSESDNVRGVSTTTNDQPVNIDDEKKQVSDQPTAPESTDKEQAAEQTPLQVEGKSEFEGKRDSPSPESSASGGSSSSGFVNVSTSDGGVADNSNGGYVEVSPFPGSDSGSSFENIDNEDDNKNPQQAPVPLTPTPVSTPVPLVPKEPAPVLPEPIPLVPESTGTTGARTRTDTNTASTSTNASSTNVFII